MITDVADFYFYGKNDTFKHNIIFEAAKPLWVKLTFILHILFYGCVYYLMFV